MPAKRLDHRLPCPAYGAYVLWPNGTPRLVQMHIRDRACRDEDGVFVARQTVYLYNLRLAKEADLMSRKQALTDWGYRAEIRNPEDADKELSACYDTGEPIEPLDYWRTRRSILSRLPDSKDAVGGQAGLSSARNGRQGRGPVPCVQKSLLE